MAAHELTDSILKKVAEAYDEAGWNQVKAAAILGIGRGTFQHRLRVAKQKGFIKPVKYIPDRDAHAESQEVQALKRQLRMAYDEAERVEVVNRALFGLKNKPLDPKKFKIKMDPKRESAEVPILFTSDFQWGETISLDAMAGLNAFDAEIASARYHRLIERTINLCLKHHVGPPPPRFIYLRGGDSISGEIHLDLQRSNDLQSIPAVRDLAEHEIWGLETLHKELGCPIEVISVPGNHGRTTFKPMSKGHVETSYDDLGGWILELYFKHKDEFTFRAPLSGDAIFDVYNTRFCLTHGDRIGSRGGTGFIGPAAAIARGFKKLADYYSGIGEQIDFFLVGHFHCSLKLEHGFSNNTLAGLSEYARDLRAKPKMPTQWLFHVHSHRGLTAMREVQVGGPGEGSLCE